MQDIYEKYKERFIEICGKNRNICLKNIRRKINYDLGSSIKPSLSEDFKSFLWKRQKKWHIFENCGSSRKTADFEKNLSALNELANEVEEFRKETGKYDLYVGFPFLCGKTEQGTRIKAPLFLFPVELFIDDCSCFLKNITSSPVLANKSLLLALKKENGIAIDIETEIYPEVENFSSMNELLAVFKDSGLDIKPIKSTKIIPFDESFESENFTLKNFAVIGRFALVNPIYDDYVQMEKHKLSSPGIDLLIKGISPKEKKQKQSGYFYEISEMDFSQSDALNKVTTASHVVIYGPPGTGKSQTIANIIADALCKNSRILVVSQKQAALDVVFSRLGKLNEKAMLLPDVEKDKNLFYERIRRAHEKIVPMETDSLKAEYNACKTEIAEEKRILREITDTLFTETDFGICLQKMYRESYMVGKKSADFDLFEKLTKTPLINKNYHQLKKAMAYISDKNLISAYLKYKKTSMADPVCDHLKSDVDPNYLKECLLALEKTDRKSIMRLGYGNLDYAKYASAFLIGKSTDSSAVSETAEIIMQSEYKKLYLLKKACRFPLLLPVYPIICIKYDSVKSEIVAKLNITAKNISKLEEKYSAFKSVLDKDGYGELIDNILRSNTSFLRRLTTTLKHYNEICEGKKITENLDDTVKCLLEFCYENSLKTEASFSSVFEKIMPLRIYGELTENEQTYAEKLKYTATFNGIMDRIDRLNREQNKLAEQIGLNRYREEYTDYCKYDKNSRDYLYQMQKKKGTWNVRRFLDYFGEYVLRLFPCWLLSPQNVSALFPLKKNLFDLVIFDEASQIFIESALPAIYRGKNILVAGDNKQLKPSSGFLKRYQADDSFSPDVELSKQAALEAVSLLDLAEAKYQPVHLDYHYRSDFSELIDFSNAAFYGGRLKVVPNVSVNGKNPPIERIKIKGIWENRRNKEEAAATVKLVKNLLSERKNFESIGIVTFNSEQKECIEKEFEKECAKNSNFAKLFYSEKNRNDDGKNNSLFVKNLENVQGDERDIIIFSIGYAKNPEGKPTFQFGSLSSDGGENRLNVAITRAKKKIYIITSMEPEEMEKADFAKNDGPKLLKKYLIYARAVSKSDNQAIKTSLAQINGELPKTENDNFVEEVKRQLEANGLTVFKDVGNSSDRIPLAIYDNNLKRYILGIVFDDERKGSSVDDYISKLKFFKNKGWSLIKIWSRDWWYSSDKEIEKIISAVKRERKALNEKPDCGENNG